MRGLILCLCLAASPATAQIAGPTGNDLLTTCSDDAIDIEEAFCWGFIAGVVQGRRASQEASISAGVQTRQPWMEICLPAGVTSDQTRRVVMQFLKSRPAQLHAPASVFVNAALLDAFRCGPRN